MKQMKQTCFSDGVMLRRTPVAIAVMLAQGLTLAQPAANTLTYPAILKHQTFEVTFTGRRVSGQVPKRKSFTRLYQYPVHFCCGQSEVGYFIDLQVHIHGPQAAE